MKEEQSLWEWKKTVGGKALLFLGAAKGQGRLQGKRPETAKHTHLTMRLRTSPIYSDSIAHGLTFILCMNKWFPGYFISRVCTKFFFFFFAIIVTVLHWVIQNPLLKLFAHLWKSFYCERVREETVPTQKHSFFFFFWNRMKKIIIGTSSHAIKLYSA